MRGTILDFTDGAGRSAITIAEAREMGCSPAAVHDLVRQGILRRVARGAYVRTAVMEPSSAEETNAGRGLFIERRHRTMTDVIMRSYGPRVAASHQSALLLWDLPTPWRHLTHRVHLAYTRSAGTSRRFGTYSIHVYAIENAWTVHRGRRLVTPALAAIGTAMTAGVEAGTIAFDAVLQRDLGTPAEVENYLERLRHVPHVSTARLAFDRADGLAESPGETRLRLLLVRMRIAFVAQFWIRTVSGRHYRADFYLPDYGVVLEYDGQLKYATVASVGGSGPRHSGRVALSKEKDREDDLRLSGFGVGRVTSGLLKEAALMHLIAQAAKQASPEARHRSPEHPPWQAVPRGA